MKIRPLENPHKMNHALNYARRDLRVIPLFESIGGACACGNSECTNIAKHPRNVKGISEATSDKTRIRQWWTQWPSANIGLACGDRFFAVDVDPKNGGKQSLQKLEAEYGKLPDTVRALTGGGGTHLLFSVNGTPITGRIGLLPGIDIKSTGGYIVAPPSRHASGKLYQWDAEASRDLAQPPAWLIDLINGLKGNKKERFDTAGALAGVPEGKRDDSCWRLACKLQGADIPFDISMKLVLEAAANCKPPFPADVAREKVERAFQKYRAATEDQPPHPAEREGVFVPQEYWHQYDVADIHTWQCPELEPLIEGILAKGNLLWLAAETQTGKTLFMLWVCLQLLNKGLLFDKFAITPVKRILYVACEDPARRFKARLLDMTTTPVEAGRFIVYVAPGLSIADFLCFQFLENMIAGGGFDLVVIDTFQSATMGVSSFDDEKLSIIIRHLLEITRKLGTTIVVNDHFRKTQNNKKRLDLDFNDIKGTGGKTQNADVFLLMDRQSGKLRISGKSKEWDRPIGFLLDIAPQGTQGSSKFTYAGNIEEMIRTSKQQGQENRERVLTAVSDYWKDRDTVSRELDMSKSTAAKYLGQLFDEGLTERKAKGRGFEYRVIVRSDKPPRTENETC